MQGCGLQPVHKGREACWASRTQRACGRALPGPGFGFALLQPVFVHAPLGLGLAMCGIAQHPALDDATVGGSQHVIAIALPQGLHGVRVGVGQRVLGFGDGGRARVIHLLPSWRASGGSRRYQGRCLQRGRSCRRSSEVVECVRDDLSKGMSIVAMTTERLHQEGNTRLMLNDEL